LPQVFSCTYSDQFVLILTFFTEESINSILKKREVSCLKNKAKDEFL